MTDAEFAELIALGHERRGVEFKGPGLRSDTYVFAKVARAVLGMANLRDGGVVAIGVEEVGTSDLVATGLNAAQLATWTFDDVAAGLASYADPSVEFDLSVCRHEREPCIVLEVRPFADMPILCKREYSRADASGRTEMVLRRGACYVRTRARPETSEIPTAEDMRDLLDFATERRLRAFLAQSVRAGVDLARLANATADGRYAAEATPAPSEALARIESRGYWRVVMRPETYVERRIQDIHHLPDLIRRTDVRLAGWSFPYVRGEVVPQYGEDRIFQELEWGHRQEWWQLHQSEQLIHEAAVPEDWRDSSEMWPAVGGWSPSTQLGVCDTLWRFTTAFEFAARLASAVPGDDPYFVEVIGVGMRGRLIYAERDECPIRFDHRYVTQSDRLAYRITLAQSELLAEAADHAVHGAIDFFRRFGWQPRAELLREWQAAMRLS
jgi:hypothetical protein